MVALVPSQDFQVPQLSPSPLHSHEPISQKRYGQGVEVILLCLLLLFLWKMFLTSHNVRNLFLKNNSSSHKRITSTGMKIDRLSFDCVMI